jgi:uncharacterized protein YjfI (DUF2170 family)
MYTTEYYSAIKNEIMAFTGKQMVMEILLRLVSQVQKDKACMLFLMRNLRPKHTHI